MLTFLIQMLVITSESTLVRPQSPASRHLSLKSSLWGHVSQPCTFWGVTATVSVKALVFRTGQNSVMWWSGSAG